MDIMLVATKRMKSIFYFLLQFYSLNSPFFASIMYYFRQISLSLLLPLNNAFPFHLTMFEILFQSYLPRKGHVALNLLRVTHSP